MDTTEIINGLTNGPSPPPSFHEDQSQFRKGWRKRNPTSDNQIESALWVLCSWGTRARNLAAGAVACRSLRYGGRNSRPGKHRPSSTWHFVAIELRTSKRSTVYLAQRLRIRILVGSQATMQGVDMAKEASRVSTFRELHYRWEAICCVSIASSLTNRVSRLQFDSRETTRLPEYLAISGDRTMSRF